MSAVDEYSDLLSTMKQSKDKAVKDLKNRTKSLLQDMEKTQLSFSDLGFSFYSLGIVCHEDDAYMQYPRNPQ